MYNSTKSYQIWPQRLDPYTLEKKFIDELTADTSSAYSITDELLLIGDYNLNYFNKTESTLLDEIASNSGLTLSNTEKPLRATSQGVIIINHGFSAKTNFKRFRFFTIS